VLTIGSNNFTNAVDTAYYVVDNVNNINTNITTVLSTLSMFTTKTAIKITPDNVIYTFEIDSEIASVISSPSALGDIQILQSFVVNSVTYNVTSIASNAFNNCTGITRVTIPSSVLTIGASAFNNCTGVTRIATYAYISNYSSVFTNIDTSKIVELVFDYVNIIPSSICNSFTNLTSLTIGSSITSIGESVFQGCTGITSVTIPGSVTSIGNNTFSGCTSLLTVTFLGLIPTIGTNCFTVSNDTGHYFVDVSNNINTDEPSVISKLSMFTTIIATKTLNNNVIYNYTIGSGIVNVISSPSVTNTIEILESFVINAMTYNITTIGANAFSNNSALTNVIIPPSVTNITANAFSNCANLETVTFLGAIPTIGANNFTANTNDTAYYKNTGDANVLSKLTMFTSKIVIEVTITLNNITYTLDLNNRRATLTSSASIISGSVTIPQQIVANSITYIVTNIGNSVFANRTNITSVTIPNSVTSIGISAFQNCSSFTSITIPSSVTSVGIRAFSGCASLINIVTNTYIINFGAAFSGLNNARTSLTFNYAGGIPDGAFNGRAGLASVTIGSNITSIGASAFSSCANLTSVTIPSSVTSIGASAFSSCSSLTSITIPASVTSVGESAFASCSSLINIVLNAYISNFGGAFFRVNNIGLSITFGYIGVIPDYACSGMTRLTSVTIGNNITSIGAAAFQGCSGISNITIPNSVTIIKAAAFQGTNLQSIIIPASVTSIVADAFNCENLNYVTFLGNIPTIGGYNFTLTGDTAYYITNNTTGINTNETDTLNKLSMFTNKVNVAGTVSGSSSSGSTTLVASSAPAVVYSIVIANANRSIIYAASGLTLYKSSNSGSTWAIIKTFNSDIKGLATNSSGSYIVSVLDNKNIQITQDFGVTWTSTTSPLLQTLSSVLMDSTGKIMYLVFDSVIYKTINTGTTWSLVNFPFTAVFIKAVCSSNASNLFLCSSSKIYISLNGGASFISYSNPTTTGTRSTSLTRRVRQRDVEPIVPTIISMASSEDGQIIAFINSDLTVSVSTNRGSSFITTTVSGATQLDLISLSPNGATIMIVDNSSGSMYISMDQGLSFNLYFQPSTPTTIPNVVLSNEGIIAPMNNDSGSGDGSGDGSGGSGSGGSGSGGSIILGSFIVPSIISSLDTNPQNFYLVDEFDVSANNITAAIFDADATQDVSGNYPNKAEIRVERSVIQNIFQYWSDSIDMTDVSANDIFYRVNYTDSAAPLSPDFVVGAIMTASAPNMNPDNNLTNYLPQDYLRYLAKCLFNTTRGVDLFANETEVLQSVNTRCRVGLNQILQNLSTNIDGPIIRDVDDYIILDPLNPVEVAGSQKVTGNPSKKIMKQILKNDPARFVDISSNAVSGEPYWYKVPIEVGDNLYFPVTIKAPTDQQKLTKPDSSTLIEDRTYLIRCVVVADGMIPSPYNVYSYSALPTLTTFYH
jgi:hypothetical protein